jgi:hypothetical protein
MLKWLAGSRKRRSRRCERSDGLRKQITSKKYEPLGCVYNSFFQGLRPKDPSGLRPAACPRDPEIFNKAKSCCINPEPTGSRGQAAGRRKLNSKHALKQIFLRQTQFLQQRTQGF